MKYAIINQDGIATSFYSPDVHQAIPPEAVEITDEQWQDYLSDQAMKRFSGGQVITRTKTVAEVKQEKIKAIQQKRLAVSEAGIVFGGVVIPTDKEAIVLLMASQIYLKDKPNKKIKRAGMGELTGAQIDSLIETIGALYDAAFSREADLYAAVEAATTVTQVEAIDINAGW